MKQNTPRTATDKRTCYVGAKVTPMQRETILTLAARCDITVSDYLLARSHDYEHKYRLTNRQTESLATLNNCRSDIINYTSAPRGMSAAKRKQLFNAHPYMLGRLNELSKLARRISAVIDELCQPNPIPEGTTNTPNRLRPMIAKATAVSHGLNAIRYITGESAHKKHLEKIRHIATYFFDGAFTARNMLEAIKFKYTDHQRLRNNLTRIEISPAEEYTRNFTDVDWGKIWEEFTAAFDNQEITYKRAGKIVSPKTYIARSKATVWLHQDSASGIPHLHAAVCRVDEFGELNNDHQIHLRAQRAAKQKLCKQPKTGLRR